MCVCVCVCVFVCIMGKYVELNYFKLIDKHQREIDYYGLFFYLLSKSLTVNRQRTTLIKYRENKMTHAHHVTTTKHYISDFQFILFTNLRL